MEHLSLLDSLTPISDLYSEQAHPAIQRNRDAVDKILNWAREYLCRPHPDLGREGPVCPFVSRSLSRNLFFIAVYDRPDIDKHLIKKLLLAYRDRFVETEPKTGNDAIFKSFLVLFPNMPDEEATHLIDQSQQELITQFTPEGLMVGEFHPKPPDKRGLWNPNFRPLYCPVPLLAIRHMVNTDILFLKGNRDNVVDYLRIHGENVPRQMYKYVNEAVTRFGLDFPLFNVEMAGVS